MPRPSSPLSRVPSPIEIASQCSDKVISTVDHLYSEHSNTDLRGLLNNAYLLYQVRQDTLEQSNLWSYIHTYFQSWDFVDRLRPLMAETHGSALDSPKQHYTIVLLLFLLHSNIITLHIDIQEEFYEQFPMNYINSRLHAWGQKQLGQFKEATQKLDKLAAVTNANDKDKEMRKWVWNNWKDLIGKYRTGANNP